MPMLTLHAEGEFVAEQPLATSPPNVGPPGLARRGAAAALPRMTVGYDGAASRVPYFPGAGIRGVLRRKAFEVVRCSRSDPFSVEDYYYLVLGGVKGNEAEGNADLRLAAERRARNPLIALFGAAAPWDRGRLLVGHAIPTTPLTPDVVRGARRDDFAAGGGTLSLLSSEDQARWAAMAQANSERSQIRARLDRAEKALRVAREDDDRDAAEIASLRSELTLRDRASYSSNSVGRPLAGYEVIPPGTRLRHRFVLTSVTSFEVGMFLAALREFSFDPFLGARRSQGNGMVSASWVLKVREAGEATVKTWGDLRVTGFGGFEAPPEAEACLEAFVRELAANDQFRFTSLPNRA